MVYDDVKHEYPRKTILFESGKNTLSAYLYGEGNEKGIIVVAPGHSDSNDIKLYEIRHSVICFDYTGCYTSEGDSFGEYTQAVYDLDALLNYVENNDEFEDKQINLFGHSLGGYAVAAVLGMEHNVKAVVVASGFDTPEEQWQYSVT